jgi:anti-sigma-K factor RskA
VADPLDLAAAEFVLGTLDSSERREFLRRLATDPAAVAAAADWQARLGPLALTAPEAIPPATLWPRIDAALEFAPRAANDNRPTRWRAAALAAGLIALAMTGIAWREASLAPSPPAIAALSEPGGAPALLVTYDARASRLRVMPVNMAAQPGRSLELWMIAGQAAPKSMGVLAAGGGSMAQRIAEGEMADLQFAVSSEPIGGSPTGAPTGPVLWSGKLVRMPDV